MKNSIFFSSIFLLILISCKKEESSNPTPTPAELLPVADFDYTTSPGSKTVYFANNSHNFSSSNWSFGEGGSSTTTNPSYNYINSGTFSVTLTVKNSNGKTAQKTKTVVVTGSSNPVADFTVTQQSDGKVLFTNTSQNYTSSNWDFGNSQTSTSASVIWQFSANGTYNVCLTVSSSDGKTNKLCKTVSVSTLPNNTFSFYLTGVGTQQLTFTNAYSYKPDGSNYIGFTAKSSDNSQILQMFLLAYPPVLFQEYTIPNVDFTYTSPGGICYASQSYSESNAYITVNEFTPNRIKGIFRGKVIKPGTGTSYGSFTITSGTFDIPFTP